MLVVLFVLGYNRLSDKERRNGTFSRCLIIRFYCEI